MKRFGFHVASKISLAPAEQLWIHFSSRLTGRGPGPCLDHLGGVVASWRKRPHFQFLSGKGTELLPSCKAGSPFQPYFLAASESYSWKGGGIYSVKRPRCDIVSCDVPEWGWHERNGCSRPDAGRLCHVAVLDFTDSSRASQISEPQIGINVEQQ